jgi:hypothetical protein
MIQMFKIKSTNIIHLQNPANMKSILLILTLALFPFIGFAQEFQKAVNNYNLFNCKDCDDKYFISTNSGVLNTPYGLRIGFLCNTGAYIGSRFGTGQVYSIQTDVTKRTDLFSVTTGLIKPVFIQNLFSIHAFIGGGYGQWWDYRWENWTKGGGEIEGGLMFSYKRIMLNFSANILMGEKTYATGDATVGLGYRF